MSYLLLGTLQLVNLAAWAVDGGQHYYVALCIYTAATIVVLETRKSRP